MLDPPALSRTLALHQAGYELIRWIGASTDRAVMFRYSHGSSSAEEGAREWVRRNLGVLPSKCRPEREEDVDRFANLLASYLEVSFELEAQPDQRYETPCGCYCPICRRLAFAGHLKTKKVTSSDKRSANVLLRQRLRALAGELAVPLDDARTEQLAERGTLLEQLALLAWSHELLRRAEGHPSGPEVLALWRLFAWTPEGAPRKGFTLTVAKILAAEAEVVAALRSGP